MLVDGSLSSFVLKRVWHWGSLLTVTLLLFFPGIGSSANYLFVGAYFPVLSEIAPDKTITGISIDVAHSVCNRLGQNITIKLYPWVRAQALVKSGQADVLIGPYKTPEREKWMDFTSVPYFQDASFFFVRAGSSITWDGDLRLLRDVRIGMVPSWSWGEELESILGDLTVDYAPTIDLCFRKLLAGRLDMVPCSPREAYAAFQRLGLAKQEQPIHIHPRIATHLNYFGFSKVKRQKLYRFKMAFEQELIQMQQRGELDQIYLNHNWTKTSPPDLLRLSK